MDNQHDNKKTKNKNMDIDANWDKDETLPKNEQR